MISANSLLKDFYAVLAKNPKVRAEFKKDPVGVLAKAGIQLPKGIKVVALEDTADTVHLVLPAVQNLGSLSEQELARVAGGTDGSPLNITCGPNCKYEPRKRDDCIPYMTVPPPETQRGPCSTRFPFCD